MILLVRAGLFSMVNVVLKRSKRGDEITDNHLIQNPRLEDSTTPISDQQQLVKQLMGFLALSTMNSNICPSILNGYCIL